MIKLVITHAQKVFIKDWNTLNNILRVERMFDSENVFVLEHKNQEKTLTDKKETIPSWNGSFLNKQYTLFGKRILDKQYLKNEFLNTTTVIIGGNVTPCLLQTFKEIADYAKKIILPLPAIFTPSTEQGSRSLTIDDFYIINNYNLYNNTLKKRGDLIRKILDISLKKRGYVTYINNEVMQTQQGNNELQIHWVSELNELSTYFDNKNLRNGTKEYRMSNTVDTPILESPLIKILD